MIDDNVETTLSPGDATTLRVGVQVGHNLRNDSDNDARYVAIGTYAPEDQITYPRWTVSSTATGSQAPACTKRLTVNPAPNLTGPSKIAKHA
ncbi:MAG: hypothetical protein ACFB11_15115 [Paracoccaceae bacterium]